MAPAWTHLIRFLAVEDEKEHLGQPVDTSIDVGLVAFTALSPIKAYEITGSITNEDLSVTTTILTVKKLLCPLSPSVCPYIRCIGLNYSDHAAEAKVELPKVPTVFSKPRTTLADPGELPIPKVAQDGSSDYEAELCVVLGKTGRDIPENEALGYVLGYTAANDISARILQWQTSQFTFSKGLDKACPLGPCIVNSEVIKDPQNLQIETVFGAQEPKTMQNGNTKDMAFSVAKLIAYLSQGTTLEAGSIIITGTPAGVGFAKQPKVVLEDGTECIVRIERIGSLVSKIKYE